MTVLLGVDPGTRRMGWGAISVEGSRLLHLGHGTLAARDRDSVPQRLASLHNQLVEILGQYPPDELALEKVFTGRNPASALTLGQARGIVLLEVGRRGLDLAEYAPAEVKLAVAGSGRASKEQVAQMVRRLLSCDLTDAGPDATDALALAICHAHGRRRRRLVERARGGSA